MGLVLEGAGLMALVGVAYGVAWMAHHAIGMG